MKSILIGNGLSIMVHSSFNYNSLYAQLQNKSIISGEIQELFKKINTFDFELVIDLIEKSKLFCDVYKFPDAVKRADASIAELKEMLIKAVALANPHFPDDALMDTNSINDSLIKYRKIFTTNYDLLLYWACRNSKEWNIKDCFTRDGFSPKNDRESNQCTIYFLHGAIHLYEDNGNILKINADKSKGSEGILISKIESNIRSGILPIFITEGVSNQKLSRILANRYLSHCYHSLRSLSGELDIFGHSLKANVDDHIILAIQNSNISKINLYYHKYSDNRSDGDIEMGRLRKLTNKEVVIYDSKDHEFTNSWCVFDDVP
jgi:hypothetical protein